MDGGTGAYSDSRGVEAVRQHVAEFLEQRDGVSANANSIFLTGGASPGIVNVLSLLIRGPEDGILIPIPQYPLYTATIALLGGTPVPYYLDEQRGWSLSMEELDRSLHASSRQCADWRVRRRGERRRGVRRRGER